MNDKEEILACFDRWFGGDLPPEAVDEIILLLTGYTGIEENASDQEAKRKALMEMAICIFNLGRAHPHDNYLVGKE